MAVDVDDWAADAPGEGGWPDVLERAVRRAALAHEGQYRKGTSPPLPYVAHLVAVAILLTRYGFDDEVVAAGLLHDAVEDTTTTIEEIGREFGPGVASIVAACTECKVEEGGRPRPWRERKREALDRLTAGTVEARAVALADKLHNLRSIAHDLAAGRDVWARFNASRGEVLAYHREAAERWDGPDPRLAALAAACRIALDALEAVGS